MNLYESRLIPVVVVDKVSQIEPLTNAMLQGGQKVLEITLRTDAALGAIEKASDINGAVIGAGTVINKDQAKAAYDAGAKFIVSPGLSTEVVEFALDKGIPVFPGCVTPSEIMLAMSLGLDTVKFFPANVYGGAKAIKSLSAPFNKMNFIPTGGVSQDNMQDFLSMKCIPAAGGSWMCPIDLVNEGKFEEITNLTKLAVDKALSI